MSAKPKSHVYPEKKRMLARILKLNAIKTVTTVVRGVTGIKATPPQDNADDLSFYTLKLEVDEADIISVTLSVMIRLDSLQLQQWIDTCSISFQRKVIGFTGKKSGNTWKRETQFCGKIRDGFMDNFGESRKPLKNMHKKLVILEPYVCSAVSLISKECVLMSVCRKSCHKPRCGKQGKNYSI